MGEDALIHVRSPVGPFARGSLQPPFLGLHASLPADHSSDSCGWQDYGWQDGSSSNSGWQSDGGNAMYGGVQAAQGWGVRPCSGPGIQAIGLGVAAAVGLLAAAAVGLPPAAAVGLPAL